MISAFVQVVRFWTQHVTKVSMSFRGVGQSLWGTLAGILAWMHQEVLPLRYEQSESQVALYVVSCIYVQETCLLIVRETSLMMQSKFAACVG